MLKVRIHNERRGQLDLSAILDIHGLPVTLQPKGHVKDHRDCFDDVLDHPHIKTFLEAKGGPWIRVEKLAVARTPEMQEAEDARAAADLVAEEGLKVLDDRAAEATLLEQKRLEDEERDEAEKRRLEAEAVEREKLAEEEMIREKQEADHEAPAMEEAPPAQEVPPVEEAPKSKKGKNR